MADKIQLRRDNATNWTTNNPVLLSGEIGVEFNTAQLNSTSILRMKIGDGSSAWNSLPYMNTGSFTPATNLVYDNGDLVILENTNPVKPTDGIKLFNKKIATRNFASGVGSSGMDYVYQPSMWRQKVFHWSACGYNGSATLIGADTFTTIGTVTARTVASNNLFTRTRRLGYVSAATAGALSGMYSTVNRFSTGTGAGLGGFFYSCRFAVTDPASVSGARMFVGMCSSTVAPTNVEPSSILNQIGVAQLSTSSTQLYLVCNGSVAQTPIPLGTNFPPMAGVGLTEGILYDLSIFASPNDNTKINYTLERVGTSFKAVGTITGNDTVIPKNDIFMGHRLWRTNNTTALAVGIDVSTVYIETDY